MSSEIRLLKYFIMTHVRGTFDSMIRFIKHEYLFPTSYTRAFKFCKIHASFINYIPSKW